MINIKSKINFVLALFILSSFVFIPPISADGGLVFYDPDILNWKLHNMDQQLCAINYENGFENMLLAVKVSNLHGKKAVWIFPIPAKPDKIVIDIIKGFPELLGYDVKEKANDTISNVFGAMIFSRLPCTWYAYMKAILWRSRIKSIKSRIEEGITIHEHIEKMGLTTELITAKDENAFRNYLTNKNLDLPPDLKSILDGYIGKEYSFVISWISDIEKFKQGTYKENIKFGTFKQEKFGETVNIIGVSIVFPTDDIYFPLKPTSVYGNQKIPILIYVMNHVTPILYPEIERATQVNYFVEQYYHVPGELLSFFNEKRGIGNLKYTKIKITAPSKYLTKDLWIKNSAPINIILADFINKYVWLWGIIFFILSSCLASMLAGIVVFRKDRPSKKKFALFGLWNFLTLIGFAIASIFLKTKKIKPELEQQLISERIIIWDNRKILFVFLFTIFFLVIVFTLYTVLRFIL